MPPQGSAVAPSIPPRNPYRARGNLPLQLFAGMVIAAVLALIGVALTQSRATLLENAASNTRNLAEVLETQTRIIMQSVDATLQGVAGIWREIPNAHRNRPGVMHAVLKEKAEEEEAIRSIYILDTNGNMLHDSASFPVRKRNFSDRSYFQAHGTRDSKVFVSPMMKGRLTGRWGMVLSRPLFNHDGSWAGVVVAALEPRELERAFADLHLGEHGLITLHHTSGTTVIRVPSREAAIGTVDADLTRLTGLLQTRPTYDSTESLQGALRLVSARRLTRYPLIVTVAQDMSDVLAPWHLNAAAYLLVALLFSLSTVWLTRQQIEAARRREDLMAALRRGEDELRQHRDHLQDMVASRTVELTRAKEAAEKANLAKSEFLSNISHELRTPMHIILSFAKLGLERTQAGEAPLQVMDQYLKRIRGSGERLLHLLNDLLDLSKLEAARMRYSFSRQSMRKVMALVQSEMEALAAPRRQVITLDVHTDDDLVYCDTSRIQQVLRNLLSNAVKFSPEGGRIDIGITDGLLPAAPDEPATLPAVEITVTDQGAGVPHGELDTIFDKFVQSSKTKSGAGGTGLGLAICKEIVLHHGGQIWAAHGANRGSVFTVVLPRGPIPGHALHTRRDAAPAQPA